MAIVSAVVAVVALAYTVFVAGPEQKKNAEKQANMQKEQMDLQKRQNDLNAAKQKASLMRAARAKRSSMITSAAANNALSSTSLGGSINALDQGLGRELDYANSMGDLANTSGDVNRSIVDLNQKITNGNINNQMFDKAFSGVGSIVNNWDGLSHAVNNWFGPSNSSGWSSPSETSPAVPTAD